jgi:hypothetical protein
MGITISIGNKTTTLRWKYKNQTISVKLPGRADAAYSTEHDNVIAVGTLGFVRIINPDGTTLEEFTFDQSTGPKFYLLERNSSCESGISIVMAYDPELEGERFWQHEIDFKSKRIGKLVTKWR